MRMLRFHVRLRDLAFVAHRLTLGCHGFDQVGSGRTLEREPVTNLSYDSLLQRLYKVNSSVASSDFWFKQIGGGKLTGTGESLSIRHDFGDYSPVMGSACSDRLRI